MVLAEFEPKLRDAIDKSELSEENVNLLRESARLSHIDELRPISLPEKTYTLGLCTESYIRTIDNLGLPDYYDTLKEATRGRKFKIMDEDELTEEAINRKMRVLFFVPPKVLTHPEAVHEPRRTAKELEACLKRSNQLQNFNFVFGLYQDGESSI